MNILEIENLQTSFMSDSGEIKAVDGVSFKIKAGETIGIVGESGCGKSVMSLSVMRLLEGTSGKIVSGSIQFENKSVIDMSKAQIHEIRGNDVAMIFQEPMTSLNPVIKIGEQIEEAIRLHLGYSNKKAKARVLEMLKLVGIPRAEAIYNEFPHQLSGGMRQRVMIALAMSCNPKLLIADEPTTALDVTIQAQIMDLMMELREQKNMTIMLITHDMAIVAEMCDYVLVMYAGRIVEEGSVYQIFENPCHPYTVGLYNSIPKMHQDENRLKPIKGIVPDPRNLPAGCKFAPRCEKVENKCWEKEPSFITIEKGHHSKCWLHDSE